MKTITGAQIRAARSLVRWSALELATAASVGVATVRRAEADDGLPSTTPANLLSIRHALETAGIEFIPENDSGPGVRLARSSKKT